MLPSAEANATFILEWARATTPVFSPNGGTHLGSVAVTMTCPGTSDTIMVYSIGGTPSCKQDPAATTGAAVGNLNGTATGTLYTTAVAINTPGKNVLRAVACKGGVRDSLVYASVFQIASAAMESFQPASGPTSGGSTITVVLTYSPRISSTEDVELKIGETADSTAAESSSYSLPLKSYNAVCQPTDVVCPSQTLRFTTSEMPTAWTGTASRGASVMYTSSSASPGTKFGSSFRFESSSSPVVLRVDQQGQAVTGGFFVAASVKYYVTSAQLATTSAAPTVTAVVSNNGGSASVANVAVTAAEDTAMITFEAPPSPGSLAASSIVRLTGAGLLPLAFNITYSAVVTPKLKAFEPSIGSAAGAKLTVVLSDYPVKTPGTTLALILFNSATVPLPSFVVSSDSIETRLRVTTPVVNTATQTTAQVEVLSAEGSSTKYSKTYTINGLIPTILSAVPRDGLTGINTSVVLQLENFPSVPDCELVTGGFTSCNPSVVVKFGVEGVATVRSLKTQGGITVIRVSSPPATSASYTQATVTPLLYDGSWNCDSSKN